MTWEEKLIKLYFYVCENKDMQTYLKSIRMSNNCSPEFTDEEAITLYIFGISENLNKISHIHSYAQNHLMSWFPKLPSYQAFNNRLNNIHICFEILIDSISQTVIPELVTTLERLIDSLPIIVAGNSRSSRAKVASEICTKGYCSSKQMYYYGLKLHTVAIVRPSTIPMPERSWITGAHENDLTAAREVFETLSNTKIYADKIYADMDLNNKMIQEQNSIILTPVKKQKGQIYEIAADKIYSSLTSKVRQPIESFFNWIIAKTRIQTANRVRSTNGLYVHVWGKFATALLFLSNFFNS